MKNAPILLALVACSVGQAETAVSIQDGPWSEPSTWDIGTPPLNGDNVVVLHEVIYDICDSSIVYHGVTVEQDATLKFSSYFSRCMQLDGNLVVRGDLEMSPSHADATSTVTFVSVDESAFVGGGEEILASDVGLWVQGAGRLIAHGTEKTSWTHLKMPALVGQITIDVEANIGWRAGDTIVITPTTNTSTATTDYDTAQIVSVSGSTVTLSSALTKDHPFVNAIYKPEVLNLSRNVVIEGTPMGRAHVMFLMSTIPQNISNVELRHLGPTKPNAQGTPVGVVGRYALHFHHGMGGTFGSVMRGVSVHDTGNHAFVPHMSHGITITECVSHDTHGEAYWWDAPTATVDSFTNAVTITGSVASKVRAYDSGVRLAGFVLGKGDDNLASGNIAVGINGGTDSAGYIWPEGVDSVWAFSDNAAHNNSEDGIFVWQNNSGRHTIEDVDLYNNGKNGIEHGAYKNDYTYRNIRLFANRSNAVEVHAVSGLQEPLIFEGLQINGDGVTQNGFYFNKHNQAIVPAVTIIRDAIIDDVANFAFHFGYQGAANQTQPDRVAIIRPIIDMMGDQWFWMTDETLQDSLVTIDITDAVIEVRPYASGIGLPVISWNARAVQLPPWTPPTWSNTSVTETFPVVGSGWGTDWDIINTAQTISVVANNTGEVRYGTGVGPSRMLNNAISDVIDSHMITTIRASHTTSGMEAGLVARFNGSSSYMATLKSEPVYGTVLRIVEITDGTQSEIQRTAGGKWVAGVDHKIRFHVDQNDYSTTTLRAKVWDASLPEPKDWDLEVENAEPILQNLAGSSGFYARTASSSSRYWRFDDLVIDY